MSTTSLAVIRLRNDCVDQVVAAAFGKMVELCAPVLRHYHSDLYHDAVWLFRTVEQTGDDVVVWWAFNESGTCIAATDEYNMHREHKYVILFIKDKVTGRWDAIIRPDNG
jgi:hypothetical protein